MPNLNRSSDLANHRKENGLALADIASSTKIGLHFLEAIEAEHFDKLPGGVYTTSYLRQYARAIGFDEEVLLRRYHHKNPPVPVTKPESLQNSVTEWLRESQLLRLFLQLLLGRQETRGHV
jgi:cytoskeletal protein RodZ